MSDALAPAPGAAPAPMLFQWLRWRLLCNGLRVFVGQTPIRLVSILVCSTLIWGGLFALGMYGFPLLQGRMLNIPLNGPLFSSILSLVFMILAVFLLFSSSLIVYGSLFDSAEANFLLCSPAPADRVFAFHFQGAMAFSSWAILLLGSPVLIAYGLCLDGTPWYFYVLFPVFFLGFVLLPGALGALICLLVVTFIPRRRKQVLVLAGLVLLAGVCWWVYRLATSTGSDFGSRNWVNRFIGAFALFQGIWSPAHWMSEGLILTASGDVGLFYYLALIWSNGLLLYLLAAWVAARLYRQAFNRMATGGDIRRRYGGAWLDRGISSLLPWLSSQTRLLIVKDFRTFRRDPVQWAQILIFIGLASMLFTFVGVFYQRDIGRTITQKSVIGLLNLSATSFLLCAYAGRFIYPMLSLEGRKFWILGLLPLERKRLLWGKFAFSAMVCLFIAEFVAVFSNLMLDMSWMTIGLHALTAAVLALGLSGLSVGLGALMPNFQETNPSKLAVGFGGTLNLVAGLLFLLLVIGLMAVPWHLYIAHQNNDEGIDAAAARWVVLGITGGLLVGAAAVFLPLRFGIRALRRMEF